MANSNYSKCSISVCGVLDPGLLIILSFCLLRTFRRIFSVFIFLAWFSCDYALLLKRIVLHKYLKTLFHISKRNHDLFFLIIFNFTSTVKYFNFICVILVNLHLLFSHLSF